MTIMRFGWHCGTRVIQTDPKKNSSNSILCLTWWYFAEEIYLTLQICHGPDILPRPFLMLTHHARADSSRFAVRLSRFSELLDDDLQEQYLNSPHWTTVWRVTEAQVNGSAGGAGGVISCREEERCRNDMIGSSPIGWTNIADSW